MTPTAALKRALNRPLVSGTTALVVSATLAGGVAVAVDRPSPANAATATATRQADEAARAQAAAAAQAEAQRKAAAAKAAAAKAAAAKAAAAKAAAAKAAAARKAAAAKAEAKRKAAKAAAARKAAAKRRAAARVEAKHKAARAAAERRAERRAAERRAEKRRAAKRRAAARSERVSRSTQRRSISAGGSPKSIARAMVASRGWGSSQFSCLDRLWSKESGWRVTANNPSSSAYGIPQALPGSKMASAGPGWQTNARTQITWGLNYISASYGSPCSAWAHSRSHNWY